MGRADTLQIAGHLAGDARPDKSAIRPIRNLRLVTPRGDMGRACPRPTRASTRAPIYAAPAMLMRRDFSEREGRRSARYSNSADRGLWGRLRKRGSSTEIHRSGGGERMFQSAVGGFFNGEGLVIVWGADADENDNGTV